MFKGGACMFKPSLTGQFARSWCCGEGPGYVWLVSIDLFGIELKSQANLLPGNPSRPASVTACYCNLVMCNTTRGAWACVEISPPLHKHLRLLSCCFICSGLSNAMAVELHLFDKLL